MSLKTKRSAKARSSGGVSIAKPFLILLFCGFFCFLAVRHTASWVKNSSYFRIKKITSSAPSKAQALKKFAYLRNQSIFNVDLTSLQKQLTWLFPEAAEVRVLKRFPDEIYIDLKDRPPFAIVVFSDKRLIVDRQGYITVKNDFFTEMLPLIYGVPRPQAATIGQPIVNQNLKAALGIIEAFNKNRFLQAFQILRLNVENTSKITFFLSEQLEIVSDQEAVEKQIDTLSLVLNKAKLDWERIRYIDLRFAQPVIKYANE